MKLYFNMSSSKKLNSPFNNEIFFSNIRQYKTAFFIRQATFCKELLLLITQLNGNQFITIIISSFTMQSCRLILREGLIVCLQYYVLKNQ